MSQSMLDKLEPVLTAETCVKMYACAYGLPEEYFDKEAIRKRQETINETSAMKTRVEETQKVPTSTRPEKTDDQKAQKMKEKAAKSDTASK